MQDENSQRVALLHTHGRMLSVWARWQEVTPDLMDRILK